MEGLTNLQHLDLSGWRHAEPSALRSLSDLSGLSSLKLQRFANDKVAHGSGERAVPEGLRRSSVLCRGTVRGCVGHSLAFSSERGYLPNLQQ